MINPKYQALASALVEDEGYKFVVNEPTALIAIQKGSTKIYIKNRNYGKA